MTTYPQREIDRIVQHESEALVAGHTPSDPSFTVRLMGDHLHISTSASFSVSAEQLGQIREILAAPPAAPVLPQVAPEGLIIPVTENAVNEGRDLFDAWVRASDGESAEDAHDAAWSALEFLTSLLSSVKPA